MHDVLFDNDVHPKSNVGEMLRRVRSVRGIGGTGIC
jgi:hypothetical protein